MEIGYPAASTVPGIRLLSLLTLVLDVQTRLAGRSERVMRIFVERGKAMSVPKVHKDTVRQKAKLMIHTSAQLSWKDKWWSGLSQPHSETGS